MPLNIVNVSAINDWWVDPICLSHYRKAFQKCKEKESHHCASPYNPPQSLFSSSSLMPICAKVTTEFQLFSQIFFFTRNLTFTFLIPTFETNSVFQFSFQKGQIQYILLVLTFSFLWSSLFGPHWFLRISFEIYCTWELSAAITTYVFYHVTFYSKIIPEGILGKVTVTIINTKADHGY